MKIGIDSYCYHRFFGDVYPQQKKPAKDVTLEWFLKRAHELKVDGVAIEPPLVARTDASYLSEIKGMLEEYKLDVVWAWGHPDGLEGGRNEKAFADMIKSIDYAAAVGAKVMRVCGASLMFRNEPHGPMLEKLARQFQEAVKVSSKQGIKLADENHIDFTSDEMLSLIKAVNSPYFGINFDTGNFMRVLDDPIKGMAKLAKYTLSTHVKDLKPNKQAAVDDWFFFSSTPVGDGLVDNQKLAQLLNDANYEGFLAVEIDFLHPDYEGQEDKAVAQSIKELRRIANSLT
ncbi:MAG TPA: sugar phosphate isomerase/epimerase family protein [Spirochaetia bacterium]|nr:sugar phosphate isomerase/epimerase family protein [Spirochaetia bacterium]